MTTTEDLLEDSAPASAHAADDLAFRRSLRASRHRRAATAARRRWSLRRRASIALAAVATAGMAGGAIAQGPSSQGAAAPSAAAGLAPGAVGDAVKALQLKLGIAADGAYGPQTRRAVRRFQRRNGLPANGIADAGTLRALGLAGLGTTGTTATSAREASAGGATPTDATTATGTADPSALPRIAQCESGGNPTAISASGRYRGKYQFDRATWRAMGGAGKDPAKATEAEQDRVAAALLAARGTAPWPRCAAA